MDAATKVHVVGPDEIRKLIDATNRLVAVGQITTSSDGRTADRVGVLDVSARPKVLLDAWMIRDAASNLPAGLDGIPLGGWDVMYATKWRWAWGGSPFALWSSRGIVMRVIAPGRAAVRTLGGEWSHEVRAVVGELSEGWITHRVGLTTTSGRTIWVAKQSDLAPALDATYDGLNLLADSAWAAALGRQLAASLQVPYEANDTALR